MREKGVRPRIAVFSGATATIQNVEPLVTSNKARQQYGLPPLVNPDGTAMRFDVLRPQRLAAPVTVYIEQFSAHPLERDAAELYGPPDGYLDRAGAFHEQPTGEGDIPVYRATLLPEDGLYPLPYMARQADLQAWEGDGPSTRGPAEQYRQPFFPDASRLFEEIDRFGLGGAGLGNLLSSQADFDFYRPAPSSGYRKGLPAAQRTDVGAGDIPPETLGEDFFPYRPPHLLREPHKGVLARVTNCVQRALTGGAYAGAIWLEGTPWVEETMYWLNLLIDTTLPIVGTASQRAHGAVGNDGDRNIVDALDYVLSRVWADDAGSDCVGAVVIQDEQLFTAREVQKADARPGGYIATGGHGGIIGTIGKPDPVALTFKPVKRHTHRSAVNMSQIPASVSGVARVNGQLQSVPVQIKDASGDIVATAVPKVAMVKFGRYLSDDASGDWSAEVEVLGRVEKNLQDEPLARCV